MSYNRGDFSFINNKQEEQMLKDAFNAMEQVNGSWDYLSQPNIPEKNTGFTFSTDTFIGKINNLIDRDGSIGHSGATYSWTMRQMEYIAKNGWNAYVTSKSTPPRIFNNEFFDAARSNPSYNEQIQSVERVAQAQGGRLTYAQMR